MPGIAGRNKGMIRGVPDYDDTEMTNEDFEAAIARSQPVELLVIPMAFSWSQHFGWAPTGAPNQGAPAVVETAGLTLTSPTLTSFVASEERQPATV